MLGVTRRATGRNGATRWGDSSILIACIAIMALGGVTYSVLNSAGFSTTTERHLSPAKPLSVATWNIAAINNNPFEYWITYDESPVYKKLMADMEEVMTNPGEKDLKVSQVFTQEMFNQLKEGMDGAGMSNLVEVEKAWHGDYKDRRIITEFLRDSMLGKKRLASMPDRLTNTIALADGTLAFRPTVINCYQGDLSSLDSWYEQWHQFFFKSKLTLAGEKSAIEGVHSMLAPILHSKYPAVSPEEEAISIPLQLMCQGIFDAILVHCLNHLAPGTWQPMKRDMCENLNNKKTPRTIEILQRSYAHNDVLFLQEVSSDFIRQLHSSPLAGANHLVLPRKLDTKRDQNSVILLSKKRFAGEHTEVTASVEEILQGSLPKGAKSPLANGDLLAIHTQDVNGENFTLGSFHGDTNGLASVPVLNALHEAMQAETRRGRRLVFALDANTYEHPGKKGEKQGVADFTDVFLSKGLSSCWGDSPDPQSYTTCNARTFLQPQLNKACHTPKPDPDGKIRQFPSKADVNLKDYILFYADQLEHSSTIKDNTGDREYRDGMFFPTMSFPSDHGIVETVLTPKRVDGTL